MCRGLFVSVLSLCAFVIGTIAGGVAEGRDELILGVDFGTQDASPSQTGFSPNRVQSGYQDFSYGPEESWTRDQAVKLPPSTLSCAFGSINVTVSDPSPASNGLIFVDEGTVTHALGALADDYVVPSGLNLEIAVSGLPAGQYTMTTYHHMPGGMAGNSLRQITVDTGGGTVVAASDVPVSVGFSPASVSSATFGFSIVGQQDLLVTVEGRSFATGSGLLNGFRIDAVPEPSGIVLLLAGAGALAAFRVWRRRRQGE